MDDEQYDEDEFRVVRPGDLPEDDEEDEEPSSGCPLELLDPPVSGPGPGSPPAPDRPTPVDAVPTVQPPIDRLIDDRVRRRALERPR